jgi:hypothetical protein
VSEQKWEYMTWGVTRPNSGDARVRYVDGKRPLVRRSFVADLEQAGRDGWELVSTIPVGERSGAMFFKRLLVED